MEVNDVYSSLIAINVAVIVFLLTASLAYYTFIKSRIDSIEIEIGDNIYEFIEKCGIDIDLKIEEYDPEYELNGIKYSSFMDLTKRISDDVYYEKINETKSDLIEKTPDYSKIRESYIKIMLLSRYNLIKITELKKKDANSIHDKINKETRDKVKRIIKNCKNFDLPIVNFNTILFLERISDDIEKSNEYEKEKIIRQGFVLKQYKSLRESVEKNLKKAERDFKKLDRINKFQMQYSIIKKITLYEFIIGISIPLILINGFPSGVMFWEFYDVSILISWVAIFLSLAPYAFLIQNVNYLFSRDEDQDTQTTHRKATNAP